MKRVYIVFAYDQYYPMGPSDVKAVCATREAAQEAFAEVYGKCDYTTIEEFEVDG